MLRSIIYLMGAVSNGNPVRVLGSGDSTIAAYLGQTAVADFVFSPSEKAAGYNCDTIAVPGNTISQQHVLWNAYTGKDTLDIVVIQIGLNDMAPDDPITDVIARYQSYINTVRAGLNTGAKIIISCMLPARQRYINVYGPTDGLISQQKWVYLNQSIMGVNTTHPNITGVDARNNYHVSILDDGFGNLKDEYQTAEMDEIHENNVARQIISYGWRMKIDLFNL